MPWHYQNIVMGGLALTQPIQHQTQGGIRIPLFSATALDVFCQNFDCTYFTHKDLPDVLQPGEMFLVLWHVLLSEEMGTFATLPFQPKPFSRQVTEQVATQLAKTRKVKPQYIANASEVAFLHRHFHETTPWGRTQPLQWLHAGVVYNSWDNHKLL